MIRIIRIRKRRLLKKLFLFFIFSTPFSFCMHFCPYILYPQNTFFPELISSYHIRKSFSTINYSSISSGKMIVNVSLVNTPVLFIRTDWFLIDFSYKLRAYRPFPKYGLVLASEKSL